MEDTQIKKLIEAEKKRQKSVINLIASENYVSKDVLQALGSELTNKYAEGYPGARYYGGNEVMDKVERLAQERALKLFKLSPNEWAVNVQPLSGSPANLAVYVALVPSGGKIMGMSLSHGGHLTHGHKVSATGKFWTQVPYGVDEKTEVLNYDALKEIAMREKPAIIVAGYTAYPRIIDFKKFRDIADSVVYPEQGRRGAIDLPQNAGSGKGVGETGVSPLRRAVTRQLAGSVENRGVLKIKSDFATPILLVDMSHFAGLIAGGAYPSPFPYADIVTTTVHKTLRGPRAAMIFSRIDQRELPKKIDKAVFPGLQGGPHLNQIAAVAVALGEAMKPDFKKYAKQVVRNAAALANELARLGWRIVSGGTDTHLILVDTWNGSTSSPQAGGNPSTSLRAGGIGGKEASE
ncbi:MAG: serine hydroxymethyltransferase, partial [Patescibacteria group bacterium]